MAEPAEQMAEGDKRLGRTHERSCWTECLVERDPKATGKIKAFTTVNIEIFHGFHVFLSCIR